jgi:hypothetical protein
MVKNGIFSQDSLSREHAIANLLCNLVALGYTTSLWPQPSSCCLDWSNFVNQALLIGPVWQVGIFFLNRNDWCQVWWIWIWRVITVVGNRLAYITSIGWREFWLRKILVISILINKLCKNLLSSSFLFPKGGKYFTLHTSFTHMPDHLRWLETGRIPYRLLFHSYSLQIQNLKESVTTSAPNPKTIKKRCSAHPHCIQAIASPPLSLACTWMCSVLSIDGHKKAFCWSNSKKLVIHHTLPGCEQTIKNKIIYPEMFYQQVFSVFSSIHDFEAPKYSINKRTFTTTISHYPNNQRTQCLHLILDLTFAFTWVQCFFWAICRVVVKDGHGVKT